MVDVDADTEELVEDKMDELRDDIFHWFRHNMERLCLSNPS